jgi:hypothetical protein
MLTNYNETLAFKESIMVVTKLGIIDNAKCA